ncbi:MAG: [LysW]-lysine hydrolase [Anaerolineales bacterium]|nr:[LysW]-lysine hydrolase [Anaerolineales bacterium]
MSKVETLLGLLEHYSPTGQEEEAVNWLLRHMQSLGFQVEKDCAGNAIGILGDGPRQILLLGHIDTVPGLIPVRFENDPQQGVVLYGRGAADAKGPLACFVDAVAQLGLRPGWQCIVIGAVDEEGDSRGARALIERYRPNYLIVGEPNRWNRIALGYKGSAWAELSLTAENRHSAHHQPTPAEQAVELWWRLKTYAETFNHNRQRMFEQLLLTLRTIQTEESDFTLSVRLRLGARLPLDLPPSAWYAKLKELVIPFEMYPLGYPIPAWECEKNTPLVRAFLRAIRQAGGEPAFVHKSGTSDLNLVAPHWKCPALVYGPGDPALDHTPHEHIPLEEYLNGVAVLVGALESLTASD